MLPLEMGWNVNVYRFSLRCASFWPIEQQESLQHSTRKHATAVGQSLLIQRQILLLDLEFQPYKMTVIQKFCPHDFQNRFAYFQTCWEIFPKKIMHSSAVKPFSYLRLSSNKTCVTDQRLIPVNFSKNLYIAI